MSPLTVFPASSAATVLDTVLTGLASLFLSGAAGNRAIARQAAAQMLAAHQADNDDELRLAGKVIGLSFQCLEALSEAAAADLSLTAKLRLRTAAVSLSRESHKAQRQLDKLHRARRTQVEHTTNEVSATRTEATAETAATETTAQSSATETTGQAARTQVEAFTPLADPVSVDPISDDLASADRQNDQPAVAIEASTKVGQNHTRTSTVSWSQGCHKRLATQRITEQLKKNQAEHAARLAQAEVPAPPITNTAVLA